MHHSKSGLTSVLIRSALALRKILCVQSVNSVKSVYQFEAIAR